MINLKLKNLMHKFIKLQNIKLHLSPKNILIIVSFFFFFLMKVNHCKLNIIFNMEKLTMLKIKTNTTKIY